MYKICFPIILIEHKNEAPGSATMDEYTSAVWCQVLWEW